MAQRFVMVSSTARRLQDVELGTYLRAGYTPALEKAHSELLPHLARPRISFGLDMLAIAYLGRNGGSAYVPQHAADGLLAGGSIRLVEDAPAIEQPVFAATHIRRRSSAAVRKAVRALHELAASPAYGNAGLTGR